MADGKACAAGLLPLSRQCHGIAGEKVSDEVSTEADRENETRFSNAGRGTIVGDPPPSSQPVCRMASGGIVTFVDNLSRFVTSGDNPPAHTPGLPRVDTLQTRHAIVDQEISLMRVRDLG
jgi:hypothetical protein